MMSHMWEIMQEYTTDALPLCSCRPTAQRLHTAAKLREKLTESFCFGKYTRFGRYENWSSSKSSKLTHFNNSASFPYLTAHSLGSHLSQFSDCKALLATRTHQNRLLRTISTRILLVLTREGSRCATNFARTFVQIIRSEYNQLHLCERVRELDVVDIDDTTCTNRKREETGFCQDSVSQDK